jgi:hypothetical protein
MVASFTGLRDGDAENQIYFVLWDLNIRPTLPASLRNSVHSASRAGRFLAVTRISSVHRYRYLQICAWNITLKLFIAYIKFSTLASVLFQKHVFCTVRSRLKSTGWYISTSILIRIQICVHFLISSTLPKVHKAPVLNKMVSKRGRGIQSVLQTELRYFQTSQLFARSKNFSSSRWVFRAT